MPRLQKIAWLLSFGVLLNAATSPAQDYPQRARLDSMVRAVDGVATAAELAPTTSCASSEKNLKRFCEGALAMRKAELSKEVKDVADARDALETVVLDEPKWAIAWYALARNRLQANRSGMVGRDGPLQGIGESNEEGAVSALWRALQLDVTYQPAWDALSDLPLGWKQHRESKDRVITARKGRKYLSPTGLVHAASLELDGGSADTAVTMLQQALARADEETPRGYAQITLARALYRVGRNQLGRTALFAGAGESDSAGMAMYREQLSWVADSAELKQWDDLPPGARQAWLTSFWGARDVREGRKDGERLVEHYRRVNIAFSLYQSALPLSGQQTALSFPGEAEFQRTIRRTTATLTQLKVFLPDTAEKVLEWLSSRTTVGAQNGRRQVKNVSQLDDRGVVFIRHGEPDKRLSGTPSTMKFPDPNGVLDTLKREANGQVILTHTNDSITVLIPGTRFEVWRYDRRISGKPLILYFVSQPFQGSSEPTTLVPTLLSEDPATRLLLCPVDPSLCPTTNSVMGEIISSQMGIDRIAQASMVGKETIQETISSDSYARPFAKVLHPSTQITVLELAQGGSPRLVFAFALPGQELTPRTTAGKRDVVYPVKIEMSAVRMSDGKRAERDTLREYVMPHVLAKGEFLSGLMELRLSPGTWQASMSVTQVGGAGAVLLSKEVRIEDYSTHLKVSDLVLGQDSVGLRWHSGPEGQPVPMNPLNSYTVGSAVSIYAQVSGLLEKTPYQAKFEIFEGREAKGVPALTIGFEETPNAERLELSRTLSLKALKPGRYLVRVTLQSGGQTAVSTGGLDVVK